MKLIAGLGNPGSRYRGTRHNVGFDVLDELARRHGVAFESAPADALTARVRDLGTGTLLVKPLTFMNLSGGAVADLARYYRVEPAEVLIVLDDVNLPLGRLRLRRGGSAGGHNGLASIVEAFGTDAIARLRIGVGRGDPQRDLADHVLARFDPDEREIVQVATARAADAAERFAVEAIETVMNAVNGEPDTGPPS